MPSTIPRVRDFLNDPLSDITRKERRNLLTAGVLGAFVVWTGLVPTKVATLGIELNLMEQKYFLILLGFIVLYFLVAFLLYGMADYFIWRERYREYLVDFEIEMDGVSMSDELDPNDPEARVPYIPWVYSFSGLLAKSRMTFEYALPVLVGISAIVALFIKAANAF